LASCARQPASLAHALGPTLEERAFASLTAKQQVCSIMAAMEADGLAEKLGYPQEAR
jgi:hypothetical protein